MGQSIGRRKLLQAGLGSAFWLRNLGDAAETALRIAGQPVEFQLSAISSHTIRITPLPIQNGETIPVPDDGALADLSAGRRPVRLRTVAGGRTIRFGSLQVALSPEPLSFMISASGAKVQRLSIDRDTGIVSFQTGDVRCSVSARAAPNLTAAARPIECAVVRAATSSARTAAAFLFPG